MGFTAKSVGHSRRTWKAKTKVMHETLSMLKEAGACQGPDKSLLSFLLIDCSSDSLLIYLSLGLFYPLLIQSLHDLLPGTCPHTLHSSALTELLDYHLSHHRHLSALHFPSNCCTWLTSMLESQLSGRTAVRSLAPSRVEMIPFWSTLRIMVASTKYISPFLSTAIPLKAEMPIMSDDSELQSCGQATDISSQLRCTFFHHLKTDSCPDS